MAAKKGGLGRGLDSLFADTTGGANGATPVTIAVAEIEPDKNQPRKTFEQTALAELAASIAEHGVLQPIIVRPTQDGMGYRIIAGERRWRAARIAGLTEVPAIVKAISEESAVKIALVENLQREDLGPVEEAKGYQQLAEKYQLTQEQIAKTVGKSRPVITNAMRLLNLTPPVLEMLEQGDITSGHAKVLLSVESAKEQQEAAKAVKEERLSVRQLEKNLKKPKQQVPQNITRPSLPQEVEVALKEILGTKVKVQYKGGKGSLQVDFSSDEELRLYAKKLGSS